MNRLALLCSSILLVAGLPAARGSDRTAGPSREAESFQLQGHVYVFRSSDFGQVEIRGSKEAVDVSQGFFRAPAVLHFDHETLSLQDTDLTWTGGGPSSRFTAISIPSITTRAGKPVQLKSAAALQYMEKQADGSLYVRTIEKDSPDAPRFDLRFTLVRARALDAQRVACGLELVTVARREELPGVSLAVGKPVLARFEERFDLEMPLGEWGGRLLPSPSDNDYRLLLVLKVTAQGSPNPTTTDTISTEEEFTRFALGYYRNPRPDLVTPAMQWLARARFLDRYRGSHVGALQRAYTCVGFFAEVMSRNPERLEEWQAVIRQLKHDDAVYFLRMALRLKRDDPRIIMKVDATRLQDAETTFALWGAFCASGEPAYLRELIARVPLVDEPRGFYEGAHALELLASNLPQSVVRDTMKAARASATPRARELIDLALNDGYAAVLHKLREMDRSDPYVHPGKRDWAYVPWLRPTLPPLEKKQ